MRVTVRPEETGDEIVAATELASAGVELLPPVLVVAAAGLDGLENRGAGLERLLAHALVEVVEGIHGLETVGLHADEEVALVAERPAPLVHGGSPDHGLGPLVSLARAAARGDTGRAAEAVAQARGAGAIGVDTLAVSLTVIVDTGVRAERLVRETTASGRRARAATLNGVADTDTLTTLRVVSGASLHTVVVGLEVETGAADLLASLAGGDRATDALGRV